MGASRIFSRRPVYTLLVQGCNSALCIEITSLVQWNSLSCSQQFPCVQHVRNYEYERPRMEKPSVLCMSVEYETIPIRQISYRPSSFNLKVGHNPIFVLKLLPVVRKTLNLKIASYRFFTILSSNISGLCQLLQSRWSNADLQSCK